MRYFTDTEFIDDGKQIDLVSIAIVAEDGRELHLQSCEFNPRGASNWVREHVFNQLALCPRVHVRGAHSALVDLVVHEQGQCVSTTAEGRGVYEPGCLWRTRRQIMYEVAEFCDPEKYGTPEFWGWCCAYDWVALCQLFGTMMELPPGWPHYMRELQYLLDKHGFTDDMLPRQAEDAHNALADARHLKLLCGWLMAVPRWNMPAVARERLLNGNWIDERKPLLLSGEAGQVHISLDGQEITPETTRRLGGYVGHHDTLVTTGGDGGQELSLPDGMTEDEAQRVFLPPITDAQELRTYPPTGDVPVLRSEFWIPDKDEEAKQ